MGFFKITERGRGTLPLPPSPMLHRAQRELPGILLLRHQHKILYPTKPPRSYHFFNDKLFLIILGNERDRAIIRKHLAPYLYFWYRQIANLHTFLKKCANRMKPFFIYSLPKFGKPENHECTSIYIGRTGLGI